MQVIDITQELFSCQVFPGDPAPKMERLRSLDRGDRSNLTAFSMCAHNGTHVDAPFHFVNDGKTIDEMGLEPFVGDCYVARHRGDITKADADAIMEKAKKAGAAKRILIAGEATLTEEAAKAFANNGALLYGNESQTVGTSKTAPQVHRALLSASMVILEGAVLRGVEEGVYFLSAAPINLGGCEGAPCRAYLIKQ